MKKLIVTLALMLAASNAYAVITEFDDIALDGAGSTPFVRFDHSADSSQFIVGFNDYIGLWTGTSYSARFQRGAPSDALVVDSEGVSIKNDLNVNSGDGSVDVELEHTGTSQIFDLTSLSSSTGLFGGGVGFNTDSALYPFWVFDDALTETCAIRSTGVSIGSYYGMYPLHVYADGSPFAEAKVVVENNLPGTPATREMFSLINNGGSRFTFTDTSLGSTWFFTSNGNGAFAISLQGTGGNEILVNPNGRVTMGGGGAANFDLKSNGNLTIAGTLTQSSDVNLKQDFRDVNEAEVLQRVAEMPVQTWQFKFDDPAVRHMGPTAQDFHASFGLGENETTIAPVDGIGVAFAAIKALKAQSDQKDSQIETLTERVTAQEQELKQQSELLEQQQKLLLALSKRLEKIESSQE